MEFFFTSSLLIMGILNMATGLWIFFKKNNNLPRVIMAVIFLGVGMACLVFALYAF